MVLSNLSETLKIKDQFHSKLKSGEVAVQPTNVICWCNGICDIIYDLIYCSISNFVIELCQQEKINILFSVMNPPNNLKRELD